jgi:hypothetical protein
MRQDGQEHLARACYGPDLLPAQRLPDATGSLVTRALTMLMERLVPSVYGRYAGVRLSSVGGRYAGATIEHVNTHSLAPHPISRALAIGCK